MERFWHLRAFRRFWWVIVASVAVALGVAWVVTKAGGGSGPPVTAYEATIALYPSEGATGQFAVRSDPLSDPAIVIEFLEQDEVASVVKEDLDFEGSLQQLTGMVEGVIPEGSSIIQITATSADPETAEDVARAFTEALLGRISELKHELNLELIPDVELEISILNGQIEQAEADADAGIQGQTDVATLEAELKRKRAEKRELEDPSPDPGFAEFSSDTNAVPVDTTGFSAPRSLTARLAIALALGLLCGLGLALIIGRVDTRIRTKRQAEEKFGLPVLAEIPVLPRWTRTDLITVEEPDSRYAEGFRILGAELVRGPRAHRRNGNGDARGMDKPPQVLVVTSAGPGEGKTTVAANLAVALADTERTVIVLSCDFRRPKIHALFGVDAEPGMADALDGERNEDGAAILERVIVQTRVEGVRLVPSGRLRSAPTELLNSHELRQLIAEARRSADIVIIDTTPILAVSDAVFIAPEADAVLLVARSGRTTGEVAERTTELLARLGCPVIGVALNRAAESILPKGYRAYYYGRPSWATPEADDGDGEPEDEAREASDEASDEAHDEVRAGVAAEAAGPQPAGGGETPTSHVTREADRI